jgi:hypothetical protein
MKECKHEPEIVEAMISGRWPAACDPELRNHAASCEVCRDVVLVSSALREERDMAVLNAKLPSAGLVWWRAELRARREAVEAVERQMAIAYVLAAAAAVGVAAALLSGRVPPIGQLLSALTNLPEFGLLAGGFAALLVAAPVALYFVFSDKSDTDLTD